MALISQVEFLKKYNISDDNFEKTELLWPELEEIYTDFESRYDELDRAAFPLFNALIKIDKVHSVRYRIKTPEHVIEKIIRKKIKYPNRVINKENYFKDLTDLIGLRAIHLFKDDWLTIHNEILQKWNQKEKPTYYYRAGDSLPKKDVFSAIGCKTAQHPRHYRSVHYVIKTNPTKQEYFAEVQVRTIFEEGWSEIDHKVSYPYKVDNKVQNDFLSILNRLAGSADEMGSFIRVIQPLIEANNIIQKESKVQLEKAKDEINKIEELTTPQKDLLIEKFSQINDNNFGKFSKQIQEGMATLPKVTEMLGSVITPELGLIPSNFFSAYNLLLNNYNELNNHNVKKSTIRRKKRKL